MDTSSVFDRKGLAALAVVAAGMLILVGCGGGDSDSDSSTTASDGGASTAKTSYGYGSQSGTDSSDDSTNTAPGGSQTGAATISVASVGDLGRILVDGKGMTLYLFEKDEGGKSACYGACAQAWPPVTTEGDPVAKDGAMAGKLGTTKRTDGTTQVTYASWPLYLYAGDTKPGQATGNDIDQFGAEWYALTPSGEKPED